MGKKKGKKKNKAGRVGISKKADAASVKTADDDDVVVASEEADKNSAAGDEEAVGTKEEDAADIINCEEERSAIKNLDNSNIKDEPQISNEEGEVEDKTIIGAIDKNDSNDDTEMAADKAPVDDIIEPVLPTSHGKEIDGNIAEPEQSAADLRVYTVGESHNTIDAEKEEALEEREKVVDPKDTVISSDTNTNEADAPSNGDKIEQSIDEKEEGEEYTQSLEDAGSIEVDTDDTPSPSKAVSLPSPAAAAKVLEMGAYGSFSDEQRTKSNSSKTLSSFNSQDLDEIDLDKKRAGKSSPLIRAYNGTMNGISSTTQNKISFTFKDSTESEAFTFLTSSLRETLGDDANGVTDEVLSRYIRYKPDVKRAAARFQAYNTFRQESYIFDDKSLLLSQDPKLTFLIQNGFVCAPEELFTNDGSGVMIIRGSKCDVGPPHECTVQDAARAIFYILHRMMKVNTIDPLKGITIILDLSGDVRKNPTRRLSNLLSKAVGCFPVRIQAIYVLSVPWWYPVSAHRKLFSTKMRPRIHILKTNAALHEFIEKDRLPEEYGGINNFDLQSWISSTVLQEVEMSARKT